MSRSRKFRTKSICPSVARARGKKIPVSIHSEATGDKIGPEPCALGRVHPEPAFLLSASTGVQFGGYHRSQYCPAKYLGLVTQPQVSFPAAQANVDPGIEEKRPVRELCHFFFTRARLNTSSSPPSSLSVRSAARPFSTFRVSSIARRTASELLRERKVLRSSRILRGSNKKVNSCDIPAHDSRLLSFKEVCIYYRCYTHVRIVEAEFSAGVQPFLPVEQWNSNRVP
jgi:hypothetical protein